MSSGILIAGTGSGCGKTTFTCGLLGALARRQIRPCAFKCGPDYIDTAFHTRVLGVPSYNLDPFFLAGEELRQLYERHSSVGTVSVVEGVMGYYDGLGFGNEASTYTVACALAIPVILLVDCQGMGSSVMAVVEGYLRHRDPSMIRGVIFNRLAPALYEKACRAVQNLGIRCLGYLPRQASMQLESRHLGLVMAAEVEDFAKRVEEMAKTIEETVDVEGILRLAAESSRQDAESLAVQNVEYMGQAAAWEAGRDVCIAVAKDEAFCFQYEDNLNFLRERGARIVTFSPLHDQTLPIDCDALYLSGGYPELYAKALEENVSMREDIRGKIEAGMPCIAECGGFLYLHERLESAGQFYKMAGVIDADALMGKRKGHFGYLQADLQSDCLLGEKGTTFKAHEFHYWESTMRQAAIRVVKPGNGATWQEGLCTKTLYAGFPHLYFYGSPEVGEQFLEAAQRYHNM